MSQKGGKKRRFPFLPGIQVKNLERMTLVTTSRRSGGQSSLSSSVFLSLENFSVLLLPGSCRGVSCRRWQLHGIMTHASCACQMSPDSRVSLCHTWSCFYSLTGHVALFPFSLSADCHRLYISNSQPNSHCCD